MPWPEIVELAGEIPEVNQFPMSPRREVLFLPSGRAKNRQICTWIALVVLFIAAPDFLACLAKNKIWPLNLLLDENISPPLDFIEYVDAVFMWLLRIKIAIYSDVICVYGN